MLNYYYCIGTKRHYYCCDNSMTSTLHVPGVGWSVSSVQWKTAGEKISYSFHFLQWNSFLLVSSRQISTQFYFPSQFAALKVGTCLKFCGFNIMFKIYQTENPHLNKMNCPSGYLSLQSNSFFLADLSRRDTTGMLMLYWLSLNLMPTRPEAQQLKIISTFL